MQKTEKEGIIRRFYQKRNSVTRSHAGKLRHMGVKVRAAVKHSLTTRLSKEGKDSSPVTRKRSAWHQKQEYFFRKPGENGENITYKGGVWFDKKRILDIESEFQ